MPLMWFLAGVVTTIACMVVVSPWLRTWPRLATLPAARWPISSVAILVAVAAMLLALRSGGPGDVGAAPLANAMASVPAASAPANGSGALSESSGSFGTAAKVFGAATGSALSPGSNSAGATAKAGAGSMDTAVASLEGRLAKGGGTPGDWELLAKSFDFLGRPADAAKARAHQLPPLNRAGETAGGGAVGSNVAATVGAAVSGEVDLAKALAGKATSGQTLFIIAKSVDSPGAPVAVFRGTVGSWPVKFTLDDSQSMIPGRNISTAGHITVEARISLKGQPLPAPGDLQGSSAAIDPANRKPLKITIDRVVS